MRERKSAKIPVQLWTRIDIASLIGRSKIRSCYMKWSSLSPTVKGVYVLKCMYTRRAYPLRSRKKRDFFCRKSALSLKPPGLLFRIDDSRRLLPLVVLSIRLSFLSFPNLLILAPPPYSFLHGFPQFLFSTQTQQWNRDEQKSRACNKKRRRKEKKRDAGKLSLRETRATVTQTERQRDVFFKI